MNPKQRYQLCQKLGFLSEQTIAEEGLTKEYTGELDVVAAREKEEACWITRELVTVATKKNLLLTSWYFDALDEDDREQVVRFFHMLLREGYCLSITTPSGIQVIKDGSTLRSQLGNFVPAYPAEGLTSHNTALINASALQTIVDQMKDERAPQVQQVTLSDQLTQPDLDDLEKTIAPDDTLELTIDSDNKHRILQFPVLCNKVRSLKLKGANLSEPELISILKNFRHLEQLELSQTSLDVKLVAELLVLPDLKHLSLNNCTIFNDDAEFIPPIPSSLTGLTIKRSDLSIRSFSWLINSCPKLSHLRIEDFKPNSSESLEIQPNFLSSLRELCLERSELGDQQKDALVNAAPNLTMLSLCEASTCNYYDYNNFINMPGSHFEASIDEFNNINDLKNFFKTRDSHVEGSFDERNSFEELDDFKNFFKNRKSDLEASSDIFKNLCSNSDFNFNKDLGNSYESSSSTAETSATPSPIQWLSQRMGSSGQAPMNQISHLKLSGISLENVDFKQQFGSSSLLTSLDLSDTRDMAKFVERLVTEAPFLLANLTHCCLDGSDIDAQTLDKLIRHCPRLTSLSIAGCMRSGGDCSDYPPLPVGQLTHFNASNSTLTSLQVSALLNASPNLLFLDLSNVHGALSELDLAPGHLSQLHTINLRNIKAKPDEQERLWQAAPNLSNMNMGSEDKPSGASLREGKLSFIDLTLENIPITAKDCSRMLEASPQLASLDISACDELGSDLLNPANIPLTELTKLIACQTILLGSQLDNLLSTTPNLRTLKIDGTRYKDDTITLSEQQLPQLTHLGAWNLDNGAKLIINLLKRAPALQELVVNRGNSDINLFSSLEPKSLLRLSVVQVANLTEPDELVSLLRAAPNLTTLDISDSHFEHEQRFKLNPGSLKQLVTLKADYSRLSLAQLLSIITAAPNLEEISIEYNRNLNQADIDYIETNYPKIKVRGGFTLSYQATDSASSSFSEAVPQSRATSGIKPAGDFRHDPATRYTVQSIFIGEPNMPKIDVSNYHLATYSWDAQAQRFTPYQPEASNLKSVQPARMDLANIRGARQNGQYHASYELLGLEADVWYQLPATSTRDTLMAFASSIPGQAFELVRDIATGYHFFRVPMSHPVPISIRFNLESGFGQDQQLQSGEEAVALQTWIRQLRFDDSGHLVRNKAWRKVTREPKDVQLAALKAVCTFEKESGENLDGEPWQLFNHMLEQREGACRHRGQLFAALASELGIPVYYEDNKVHAFAIAGKDDGSMLTVQLGGAEAMVNELPVSGYEEEEQEQEQEQEKEERPLRFVMPVILEPPPTNRYQTWNNHPLHASEALPLVGEIVANSQRLAQQMIITEDQASLDCLHRAVLRNQDADGHILYTHDLNAMTLSTSQLRDDGHYQRAPSAIAQLLNRAEQHPEEIFTWFIDWSGAQLKHKGLSSLFSGTPRQLLGRAIPDNVHLVVLTDKDSLAGMSDALTSRLSIRSMVPRLVPTPYPPQPVKPVEDGDAVIDAALNWKKILLGTPVFEGKTTRWEDGALPRALAQGASSLTLHNAPLENKAFAAFLMELEETRQFELNGKIVVLPDEFSIQLAQPEISYPLAPFDYSSLPGSQATLTVNAASYSSFFSNTRLDEDGFHTLPGLLEKYANHKVFLNVSGQLTPIQWWTLTKEAERWGIGLVLQPVPGITLPETFPAHPARKLKLPDPIQVLICNDVDTALLQTDCESIIPISKTTRFEALFTNIQRHPDGSITATDSDLLKAIKRGEVVGLKGKFSAELVQKISSALSGNNVLLVNGESVPITKPFYLLSDDGAPFDGIDYERIEHNPEHYFSQLSEPARQTLRDCYQRLNISPCHSHFENLPRHESGQMEWVDAQVRSLFLAAGKPPPAPYSSSSSSSSSSVSVPQVSTPESLLEYLNAHPFAFLISESGAGKSYLMQELLPEYGKKNGTPVTVYNSLSNLEAWAKHTSDTAILFIDEANISTEDYLMFDNLARGERVLWISGKRYELSENQKVVFAGNPYAYGGRMQADLFRRFPYYVEFRAQPLYVILEPVLSVFEDANGAFAMIELCYKQAQEAGIIMTPRNAIMICQRVAELKLYSDYALMSERLLLLQAMLTELKGMRVDKTTVSRMRQSIKNDPLWVAKGQELKDELRKRLPKTSEDYHWTEARMKVAIALLGFLGIREQKCGNKLDQSQGINGFLLEGPGLGKGKLLMNILQELKEKTPDLPLKIITLDNALAARRQLIQAHREGSMVYIPRFSNLIDERLVNDLLTTPGEKPGFCILGVHDGGELSKALSNRFSIMNLKEDSIEDLQAILRTGLGAPAAVIDAHIREFEEARDWGKQQNLTPLPSGKTLVEQVRKDIDPATPVPGVKEISDCSRETLLGDNGMKQLLNKMSEIIPRLDLKGLAWKIRCEAILKTMQEDTQLNLDSAVEKFLDGSSRYPQTVRSGIYRIFAALREEDKDFARLFSINTTTPSEVRDSFLKKIQEIKEQSGADDIENKPAP